MPRFVLLSDTHTFGKHITVPDGDILIHAGDHTFKGTEKEIKAALEWLDSLPHAHKIFIAGNHDFLFQDGHPKRFRDWSLYHFHSKQEILGYFPGLTYLQDSHTTVMGYKIYGSPWQPEYGGWAFNFLPYYMDPTHEKAKRTWGKIPIDTEILITHTPPLGIRDLNLHDGEEQRLGDPNLRDRLSVLENLKLHVFGHIHGGYGIEEYVDAENNKIIFANAAICTEQYKPTNVPLIVDLPDKV